MTNTLHVSRTLGAFLSRPRGAYFASVEFCAFCSRNDLLGLVVWGRPGIAETRSIIRVREAELRMEPHLALFDYRLLDAIDPDAFQLLADWIATHATELGRVTKRVAVLKPRDVFTGAVVGGFYSSVRVPYPGRVFERVEEAEQWLGVPVAATLAEAHLKSRAGLRTTSAVSRLLTSEPAITLAELASRLHTTPRTLQRRLRDENTTFARQSREAKVFAAKRLLTTTDAKLPDIARQVGCSSAAHFSVIFRAATGVPPSVWRTRRPK